VPPSSIERDGVSSVSADSQTRVNPPPPWFHGLPLPCPTSKKQNPSPRVRAVAAASRSSREREEGFEFSLRTFGRSLIVNLHHAIRQCKCPGNNRPLTFLETSNLSVGRASKVPCNRAWMPCKASISSEVGIFIGRQICRVPKRHTAKMPLYLRWLRTNEKKGKKEPPEFRAVLKEFRAALKKGDPLNCAACKPSRPNGITCQL